MSAYYNEIDPYAAQWIRNLIRAGHITDGEVDERSIVDVRPDDVRGFTRAHFFAGIGVWDYALTCAGWPSDRPVWTGSCPCQPFSAAGKGGGTADERHLWPAFFHLIEGCGPATVLGEQVASKDGLDWFDLVQADMEGAGYGVAAADLCAAGVGAPHIRQRLWFLAHARGVGRFRRTHPIGPTTQDQAKRSEGLPDVKCRSVNGALAHADAGGCGTLPEPGVHDAEHHVEPRGYWRDADWLQCRDGKARPVEPGTFPLAHGAPARVGRLRAYGNAICAPVAAEFIAAVMEVRP